jgi:hypothetical protein
MKLSNLFKKATQTVSKANIETLEKKQLEKVVGGVDTTTAAASTGKQTQGTTFGEKVNAGLHQAGGVLAQGAS